jgi:G patch domain-containing protein 1
VQPGATEHGEEGPRNNAPDLVGKMAIDDLIRETGGFNSNWNERPRERIPAEPVSVPVEKKEEVVVDAERNEALEGQRAGEAVFKAIFGDDSDDEE